MSEKRTSSEQSELNDLRELSARIGRNPLLVQASSGNTSIKIDDALWIKASGKWLIHAEEDDFLVSVNLANAVISSVPRASIETAMHAVLPHKVVVHVHSVNTIAWAVREDGPKQLSARLSGIPWQWIPYAPSGAALAKKIECALSCFPETSVFVLGNHGLVVCGDSCRSAEQLLSEVEQRLAVEPRQAPQAGVHALATDPISRRILAGGVLYPCQAIFLPEGFLTINDQRVYAKHMTQAEQEMLVGLVNVIQRIDASAPVRYLTAAEVMHVMTIESESYRQTSETNCR